MDINYHLPKSSSNFFASEKLYTNINVLQKSMVFDLAKNYSLFLV